MESVPNISDAHPIPKLRLAADVEGEEPHFEALSERPWLAIEPAALVGRGRWFRIRYRLGLYDRPVRPIISFRCGSQEIGWHLLPGPALGRGEGLAIAPAGATAVWISPVARKGPFGFVLESIEILPLGDVFRLGLSGNRGRFFSALATFAVGWRPEADANFRWATQHSPLADWPEYRRRRAVAPDLDGLERPRCDWASAPAVRLFARLDENAPIERAEMTLAALQAQIFPHWSLSIAGAPDQVAAVAAKDKRIRRFDGGAFEGADGDLAGFIGLGDRLAPHALACFIEAMRREREPVAAYCDEDAGAEPIFKPDWSPHFEAGRSYVGRLLLTRLFHARRRIGGDGGPIAEETFAGKVLRGLRREDVLHIPRPLIETAPRGSASAAGPRATVAQPPHVTVIMPTRDAAEMLRRSAGSLLERTAYSAFDLVIVDNGSVEPEALAALSAAERDPRVTRVDAPGIFNFSRLCNLGAAHAKGEILIFLNNDVEVTESDWIGELAVHANNPHVGAVGGMLLYPDSRIQHAGVIVGMGEGAGHSDAGLSAATPGWLGRNKAVHEISAVTGACLAIERKKFMAAGGFDELRLPIEFNDVDLCLRLEELGFQTLWTPFARLTHFESASRGKATFRRLDAHAAERAYFMSRWTDRLRDDPFYHPGLSLFCLIPALA